MRRWWLCVVAMALSPAGAVPVWRWVDENGVIHYSDRPFPGAEQIELTSAPVIRALPPRPQPRTEVPDRTPGQPYRRLEITSPGEQETLWNIAGTLEVELAVEPPLRAAHQVDLYLDGERRQLNAASTRLMVGEVYRGVHRLQAVILDAAGSEVQRSPEVTFTVQQTSILNPNNPNAPSRAN